MVQLNDITESGVGIRHRLALPKHCWSLQQTWRDQEVLGIKRLNPTNLQLLNFSDMMLEKGGPRGDLLQNWFGWRSQRFQIQHELQIQMTVF